MVFFHIFLTLYFFSVKNFPVFNRSNPETTKFDSVFLNIQATPRKTVRRLELSDIPCGMKVKTNDKKPHENSFLDEERLPFLIQKAMFTPPLDVSGQFDIAEFKY